MRQWLFAKFLRIAAFAFFLVPLVPLWLKLSTMPPPEKLFIYEIAGRVYPPEALTREDFLGCWREGDHSYLFFGRPQAERVKAWAATQAGVSYTSETVLNYADWEAGRPLQKTSLAGFHLCPVWETPAPGPGEIVIRMEPGLAFGSGYHPTTRRCLELLRRVYEADTPRQVLDLGSGTGILTLAALALGAEQVVAVEYNELAVLTCVRNLRHNHRRSQVHLIQADARHFAHLPASLVLANIHLDVLLDLLDIPEFLKKDWYIFSGILGAQLERFLTRLAETPLRAIETLDENMWFSVLARRKD
jgi:ribosomal protein L11 methyltransferase